jgi:hypothetical protein
MVMLAEQGQKETVEAEKIRVANDPGFNDGEKSFLKFAWSILPLDPFCWSLFRAMFDASPAQLKSLFVGFPQHVMAFQDWENGRLKSRVRRLSEVIPL